MARLSELEVQLRIMETQSLGVVSQAPIASVDQTSVALRTRLLAAPDHQGNQEGWVAVRRKHRKPTVQVSDTSTHSQMQSWGQSG